MYLRDYIEQLEMNGQLWFSRQEALAVLKCSSAALGKAASILKKQNKLAILKPNFFIIIPVEYRNWGIIPAEQFIDPLMAHLGLPYYVGLLSAAEIYGASHQRPQQYQVITNQPKKPFHQERVHIKFFHNQITSKIPTQKISVKTGYIKVSTPEATALDLVKHYKQVGFLNNVGTVLSELVENIDVNVLVELSMKGWYELPVIQRLGYLLSHKDISGHKIAQKLSKVVKNSKPRLAPLNPSSKRNSIGIDEDLFLYINDEVDIDL